MSPTKATAASRSSASCPRRLPHREPRSPRNRSEDGQSAGQNPERDDGEVEDREVIAAALSGAGGKPPPLLQLDGVGVLSALTQGRCHSEPAGQVSF
jgi:hypothetical protein